MPPEDREAIQERRVALLERTDPFGPHMRWRLRHYVLRSIFFIPIVTAFITPIGFDYLWVQLPLAALYGVGLAFLRPGEEMCGFMLMGLGAVSLGLTGHFTISLGTVLALLIYFIVGMVIGVGQWLRRMDGE